MQGLFRTALAIASVALLAVVGVRAEDDEHTVVLTPDNFDQIVDGSKPVLVKFYAPWCGHCKQLAPVYEELAQAFQHAREKVVIAKVDADAHRALGTRFGITGFPTLRWFEKGGNVDAPEDYEAGRSLEDMAAFVEKRSGVRSKIKKEPSHVVELTDANFSDIVMDPTKHVLVEFFAPWCGHCKQLAPVYEKVARDFLREENVVIASLDATAHPNAAKRFSVSGYPTIKYFGTVPPGRAKVEQDYDSDRSEEAFVAFLNNKCRTDRRVGGGLGEMAGRIEEMDALVKRFIAAAAADAKQTVIDEASQLSEKLASKAAAYYAKVLTKLQANAQYAATELQRLIKIVQSGSSIAEDKLDFFTVRQNILTYVSRLVEQDSNGTEESEVERDEL